MKVKDNRRYLQEQLAEIPRIVRKLANKTMAQLEKEELFIFPEHVRETRDLTADSMVMQSIDDRYCFGNVMGFLGCGSERLTITSRFAGENQDYFLCYLLEKVLDYPNVFAFDADANSENQVLNLLEFLFARYLQEAMRKGLFKTYIRFRYNDSNPKGAIDVARHIKTNTPFLGKVAYSQREYSYDNDLIRLIRHTIEFIKRRAYGRHILSRVKDEVKRICAVTENYNAYDLQKVLAENKKHIVRHAYFREYCALQKLCILILERKKQGIGSGTSQIYGILFDGAWLWEEYVATLVSERFYHPRNKAGEGAQRLFTTSTGKIGKIYPDFIGKDESNPVIADAKYKPIGNIMNPDYFQVLAYMLRFDAKKGFYFYPESEGNLPLTMWLNKGYEATEQARDDICLIKYGLQIPQNAESYPDFCEKMKAAEMAFVRQMSY